MQLLTLYHAASYCHARLNVIKSAVTHASLALSSRRTNTLLVLHALPAYVELTKSALCSKERERRGFSVDSDRLFCFIFFPSNIVGL